MKRLQFSVGLAMAAAAAAVLSLPAAARADTTIDTVSAWDGMAAIFPFGEPDTATYGQTFTAPADNALNSFTFYMKHTGGGPTQFRGYVMAWDGQEASGPVLYESATMSTTSSTFQPFVFNTGGVTLTPGQQYVAFLNESMLFDGVSDAAEMGGVGPNVFGQSPTPDAYAGGNFVWDNNGSNFSLLSSQQWDHPADDGLFSGDAAFTATFASPVPEPGSLALLVTGGLPLLGCLRRRRLA